MITVEQARKLYPPGQCPPDRVIERVLAISYAIAEREWQEILDENDYANRAEKSK